MSCAVGCRHGSYTALLWLWHKPVATAPIGPLTWEPPYATSVILENTKKKKKKIINKQQSLQLFKIGPVKFQIMHEIFSIPQLSKSQQIYELYTQIGVSCGHLR